MYLIKYILLFSLLPITSFHSTYQKSERVSGLLFLQSERSDNVFDLLLPCKLDSTKTLLQNIHVLKKGVAEYVDVLNSNDYWGLINKSQKFRNQSLPSDVAPRVKYVLVIPVNAEFDMDKAVYLGQRDRIFSWPVTIVGKKLFETYHSKTLFLKNYSILTLPKED